MAVDAAAPGQTTPVEAATTPLKPAPQAAQGAEPRAHSGIYAFCLVSAFHQRPCDPELLAMSEGYEQRTVSVADLQLIARRREFAARAASFTWVDLKRQTFPVLAELHNGDFLVLARVESDRLVLVEPRKGQPLVATQEQFETIWTGRLVLLKPKLSWDDPNRRFGLAWFLPVVKKYRKVLLEVGLAAFVIQIFALATPLFTQLVIDKVLVHRSLSTLNVLGIGMLAVIAFEGVLNVLKVQLLTHTSNRIDATLGSRLFGHLLRIPLRYFEERRVGDTVARVRELESIRQFLTGSSMMALIDILFLGVFIPVMLLYSVQLTLVVLGTLPLLAGLSLASFPALRQRLSERFDRGAEYQSFLVEAVTGILTVKALALENQMYRRWEALLTRYVMASYRTEVLAGVVGSLGQVVQRLITLLLLWYGVHLALDGIITVGQLIAFQMIAGQVTGPVLRMVQTWQHFQQVGVSIQRLGDLMNTPAEPILNTARSNLPPLRGQVSLQTVRFSYRHDAPPVVRDVDLEVASGTFVGIVGSSGSGKSTLAKLLQRLYLPDSGAILLDGIDLKELDPVWLRRQIGVVLQENYLFNGSIRDNIAIHIPDIGLERVREVATLAGADEFIANLPDGYETLVGERGASLSGGQRQRVAIARALLTNPRILIFDEATSALDYQSERIIQANLGRISAGRTVFMVAHRLSAVRHADLILVMAEGQVVERGTHEQLIAMAGVYANLFSEDASA
ncbi:MAG: type I secretion system permease/ATPase [Gallionellaceae bacterium]|nr:type I secretion system permease/ATPase [Gallionellaceae bacterium]